MRVHHIANDYSMYTGGAQRIVRILHTSLRNRDIESYILGLTAHQDDKLEGAQSLGLQSPYGLKALYGIRQYVAKNVKSDDIVHAHMFPTSFYLSLLKASGQLRGQLFYTEHSSSNRRRGTVIGYIIDIVTYASYKQIIAISEGAEQELLKWKPKLQGKTRVIYNGIRLHFKHRIKRQPKERLRILSVGRLSPAKNYENALKAIFSLGDWDFEYHIAGDGQCAESLNRQCRELGLEYKVRFLGRVDKIPELLASADIFLMPSRWEGFGLAAVEAMNASLPLVASNVPGLREIVSCEPPCALLIDPESPGSIAVGLRKLLVSHELRLQFGKNAFQQAQKFSDDRMVENHLNLYAEFV